jgi:hypothetical protein
MNLTASIEEQQEIRQRIEKCNEKLGYLTPHRAALAAELEAIDITMMEVYREKWSLEKRIVPLMKCKPCTSGVKLTLIQARIKPKMPKIKELSDEMAEELFKRLKG